MAVVIKADEELRALLRRAYETERKARKLIEQTEELLRQSRALQRGGRASSKLRVTARYNLLQYRPSERH
jgi:hypothetical protein